MYPLIITAAFLGFIHTILGPDHYVPFVALSKSNQWSYKKTMFVSTVCGLAHCLSSVVIGIFGVGFGVALSKIKALEDIRGDVASYLMIGFGLVYLIWSIKKLVNGKEHTHSHLLEDHVHIGDSILIRGKNNNLFWGIFIVFLFGPCEPLIPLLMYPAAKAHMAQCVIVALVFTLITVSTMLVTVSFALKGLSFIGISRIERYSHALASLTIIACGILIILGL